MSFCPYVHPRKPRIWREVEPRRVESLPAREERWRCDKQAGHGGLCEHRTEMGGLVIWAPQPPHSC